MIMDIEYIEVGCYGCRSKIDIHNECYCEACVDRKDEEIATLKKEVERLEDEVNNLISQIRNLER
jgi:hypothetical protein